MTNTNHQAKTLGITAIKTEIARRNPVNDQDVEDAVAHRLRIDELGVPYVVDRSGVREDMNTLEQFLDSVVRDRPELFKGRPSQSHGGSSNPFLKGPGYNVTAQMSMLKTNPNEARRLARDAGIEM